jgi:putative copper resistance protein D
VAGLIDVLLRGLALVGGSLALGGVAFLFLVLRDAPVADEVRSLRLLALGAALVVFAQIGMMAGALAALGANGAGWPLAAYLDTAAARLGLARAGLAAVAVALALGLARWRGCRPAWWILVPATIAMVVVAAGLSHALGRLSDRAALFALDAVHQVTGLAWVGGLVHLYAYGTRRSTDREAGSGDVARRFSALALASVAALVAAGAGLSILYVGDLAGLVGTAYGLMVLTKAGLLGGTLVLAGLTLRLVRRLTAPASMLRMTRLVEVEVGLAVTVLFAAASLTSQPPAVDVRAERASVGELRARFAPGLPRLTTPAHADVVAGALTEIRRDRRDVDREWSEFNHNWAGVVVLAVGVLSGLDRLGMRWARHWPLLFLVLAGVLFARNDPEVWPLGPGGFWESLGDPEVLQHRVFMLLISAFASFEWAVRTDRIASRPWAYVFPVVCAVGSGMLLVHTHAVTNVKEAFFMEASHAAIGILGAFAGWARWLELRLPGAGPVPGRVWPACLILVGLLLTFYRES